MVQPQFNLGRAQRDLRLDPASFLSQMLLLPAFNSTVEVEAMLTMSVPPVRKLLRSLSLKPCQTECMRSMTANRWLGNQVMMGLPPVAYKGKEVSIIPPLHDFSRGNSQSDGSSSE